MVRAVTLDELIRNARAGKVPPVCLLCGSERVLLERAVDALRTAALGDGPPGFNDDVFQGQGLSAQTLLSAARTMPMMAKLRFVLVRNLDAMATAEQETVANYFAKPSPDACVVLVGEKLDGRSKLAKAAKEKGAWFDAESPKPFQVPEIAQREAEARGHVLGHEAAAALSDALGADLSALDDALERLSLYVGQGKPIELAHVEHCVARVRTESIWSLVDAVGARDAKTALTAASSLLGDREPPLKILALVARQLRMVAKMREALASGLGPQEAAVKAGAAPFKARELGAAAKRFDEGQLARAFRLIADADLALKGSKVPGPRVLERTLLELCR
jgi:DNA polymerase-3 subunit delta